MNPTKKQMRLDVTGITTNFHFNDFVLGNPITDGLILQRVGKADDLGHVRTNIPHLVTHYKAEGFEFGGYGWLGSADLALNIIEILLSRKKYKGKQIQCNYNGTCFAKSLELHLQFDKDFMTNAPKDGCVIPYAMLEKWIDNQLGND